MDDPVEHYAPFPKIYSSKSWEQHEARRAAARGGEGAYGPRPRRANSTAPGREAGQRRRVA